MRDVLQGVIAAASVLVIAVSCAPSAPVRMTRAARVVRVPISPAPTVAPVVSSTVAPSAPVVSSSEPPASRVAIPLAGGSGGTKLCEASWYAYGIDPSRMTAASRTIPRGSRARVAYGDRAVVVLINDHGPQAWTRRCIDLSKGAFARLADPGVGVIDVVVTELRA